MEDFRVLLHIVIDALPTTQRFLHVRGSISSTLLVWLLGVAFENVRVCGKLLSDLANGYGFENQFSASRLAPSHANTVLVSTESCDRIVAVARQLLNSSGVREIACCWSMRGPVVAAS